jgi:hypothetical protein
MDVDDKDEDTTAVMLIPLLWAAKMMEANNEFLAELASMMPLDDPKDVLKRMLAKHQRTH